MKFIESSVEIIKQGNTIIDGFKHIEKAARNCYKSEDKIDDNSWERIIQMLLNNKHYSPLEHFTVYLTYNKESNFQEYKNAVLRYKENPYSRVVLIAEYAYITTNYRVIVENNWDNDLNFMTFPSHRHEHRVTVLMNCSIGVSREANRHRTFSISEQSTRYCNYSRDKFGNEITYVIPQWIYKTKADWEDCVDSLSGSPLNYLKGLTGESLIKALSCHDRGVNCWISILRKIESDYTYLIREEKFKPQEARSILPLDTATSVYYTAYVSDWQHFFKLRCSEAAHPDIKVLADDLQKKFKEANLI